MLESEGCVNFILSYFFRYINFILAQLGAVSPKTSLIFLIFWNRCDLMTRMWIQVIFGLLPYSYGAGPSLKYNKKNLRLWITPWPKSVLNNDNIKPNSPYDTQMTLKVKVKLLHKEYCLIFTQGSPNNQI